MTLAKSGARSAIVVGAGFGGLALAIRLQAAGIATTIVEAREKPGGRAYVWHRDGFTFDGGPTVITDPACLAELWHLTGHAMAEDVSLLPVAPFYRLSWPDGTRFDYGNDDAALTAQIRALNPEDVAGYARFLEYASKVYEEGYVKLGHVPFLDPGAMVKAAPALLRSRAWRSVYAMVCSFVHDPRLRQALSFHTLLVGGNPMTTSAIYALIHKLERTGGVWFPEGGTHALVRALARHFERIGGTLILGDPVIRIEAEGGRVCGITCASGATLRTDAIASNADVMTTYRVLLADHRRGRAAAAALARKRFSPSLFVVHFGLQGTFADVPHHSILFGPRYRELLKDIYQRGRLPDDCAIYLHHPTATDRSLAPPGCSTFYALAPVPHLGKLAVDWPALAPAYADRILDEVERRALPGLRGRLRTRFHYTPQDFADDLGAHLGSAFSLEPLLTQSAYFRVHNRDDCLTNLYFVGAGTHPGAGIPGVVGSAKATAGLIISDLAIAGG